MSQPTSSCSRRVGDQRKTPKGDLLSGFYKDTRWRHTRRFETSEQCPRPHEAALSTMPPLGLKTALSAKKVAWRQVRIGRAARQAERPVQPRDGFGRSEGRRQIHREASNPAGRPDYS